MVKWAYEPATHIHIWQPLTGERLPAKQVADALEEYLGRAKVADLALVRGVGHDGEAIDGIEVILIPVWQEWHSYSHITHIICTGLRECHALSKTDMQFHQGDNMNFTLDAVLVSAVLVSGRMASTHLSWVPGNS